VQSKAAESQLRIRQLLPTRDDRLFGLSMDYEVFMLARMREAYDETGSTEKAIELGLARTGKLVTSAALVLMLPLLVRDEAF
jgi:uncharacterized membrane protein YdfJ with MMPL/SSD domain